MTFVRPLLLIALPVALLLPFLTLFLLPRKHRKSRIFNAALRALLLALLVLALADPLLSKKVDGRAVAFLVDQSLSVPGTLRPGLQAWLERARADLRAEDAEQVILFADGAGVEIPFAEPGSPPPPPLDLERPRSRFANEATDIGAAIRLAVASFPKGRARRIVLVTDGNENRGDAVAEARRAAGDGVDLQILPVRYDRTTETSVLRVDAPDTAPPESVVSFSPVLYSTEADVKARLVARVDGQEVDSTEVTLPKGKFRAPEFRVLIPTPGSHEVSVSVEAENDTIAHNNEARASVRVLGRAGVLVIDSGEGDSEIRKMLADMDIPCLGERPAGMFSSAILYQPFDAVVLSDVSALDLTASQLAALEIAVRDLGVGLLVVGGENAYAPGGYADTPLERILPLSMKLKQKQVLLNGALVLILHTCEFENGNDWAMRIAKAAIGALSPKDFAGVVIYGNTGDEWALKLQPVIDPASMVKKLEAMDPGDMPSFDSSLRLATAALIKAPAHLKHIVIISDGDAGQADGRLIKKTVEQMITVSAVCIAPHRQSDVNNMASVAKWGKGRFYNIKPGQVKSLPEIFIKEATTLRRGAIRRKPFAPRFTMADADLPTALRGFGSPLPKLTSHTLTEPKERAEIYLVDPDDSPVLAYWRCGLGEVMAFTSAVKGGWLGDWDAWDGTDRFFAQVTRAVFRKTGRSGYHAKAEARGGRAKIRITALSDAGEEIDFISMQGHAVFPDREPQPFTIAQMEAGVYEGEFPVDADGSCIAIVRYRPPAGGPMKQLEVPVSSSYPEEYADLGTDEGFLQRLKSEAGATILTGEENVFRGKAERGEAAVSLATLLLVLVAILLPVDVFFRRVKVDFRRFLPKREVKAETASPPAVDTEVSAPDFETPEPVEEREEAPHEPEEPPARPDDEPGSLGGLLEAKKRAKRKQRWEETGQ